MDAPSCGDGRVCDGSVWGWKSVIITVSSCKNQLFLFFIHDWLHVLINNVSLSMIFILAHHEIRISTSPTHSAFSLSLPVGVHAKSIMENSPLA